jgi:hypothetical protein
MKKTYPSSLAFVAVIALAVTGAACGGDSENAGVDAAPADGPGGGAGDGPPTGAMITITGTAVERTATGTTPVANVTIAGYRNGEATPVATTTSNAQGQYSLVLPTGGGALDGYLKATAAGLKDTYLYPPAPLSADTVAPVNMISPGTLTLLGILTGVTQQADRGLIAMIVVSGATADSMPVAGAVATSTPAAGAIRYNGSNELPDQMATSTGADGTAFLINVPADTLITVSATKTGSTFTPHTVRAVANQFTTTLVTP